MRPGFSALLDCIEGNGVRTVLVEDASRFARDLVAQELGVLLLIKRNVRVPANGDDLTDTSDPSRVMMRQIAGSFAQYEKTRLVTKPEVPASASAKRQGNVRAGSPMRSATRSGSLRPSACIGGRPKGGEGHCGLLRTNCRRWATAIGVARRTRHRALSRWWRGRLLERTPVDFGGVILEQLVVPHHLVPSTQSSTSAGRGRSVTSLAMC